MGVREELNLVTPRELIFSGDPFNFLRGDSELSDTSSLPWSLSDDVVSAISPFSNVFDGDISGDIPDPCRPPLGEI